MAARARQLTETIPSVHSCDGEPRLNRGNYFTVSRAPSTTTVTDNTTIIAVGEEVPRYTPTLHVAHKTGPAPHLLLEISAQMPVLRQCLRHRHLNGSGLDLGDAGVEVKRPGAGARVEVKRPGKEAGGEAGGDESLNAVQCLDCRPWSVIAPIVSVMYSDRGDDQLTAAIPLAEGDMKRMSERHSAPQWPNFAWMVGCMVRIAEAVRCLHDRGIVHRTIKPSNILMYRAAGLTGPDSGSFLVPVLADCGNAVYMRLSEREPTEWRPYIMTAQYQPPEAVGLAIGGRPDDVTGVHADMASLGLTFLSIVTNTFEMPKFRRLMISLSSPVPSDTVVLDATTRANERLSQVDALSWTSLPLEQRKRNLVAWYHFYRERTPEVMMSSGDNNRDETERILDIIATMVGVVARPPDPPAKSEAKDRERASTTPSLSFSWDDEWTDHLMNTADRAARTAEANSLAAVTTDYVAADRPLATTVVGWLRALPSFRELPLPDYFEAVTAKVSTDSGYRGRVSYPEDIETFDRMVDWSSDRRQLTSTARLHALDIVQRLGVPACVLMDRLVDAVLDSMINSRDASALSAWIGRRASPLIRDTRPCPCDSSTCYESQRQWLLSGRPWESYLCPPDRGVRDASVDVKALGIGPGAMNGEPAVECKTNVSRSGDFYDFYEANGASSTAWGHVIRGLLRNEVDVTHLVNVWYLAAARHSTMGEDIRSRTCSDSSVRVHLRGSRSLVIISLVSGAFELAVSADPLVAPRVTFGEEGPRYAMDMSTEQWPAEVVSRLGRRAVGVLDRLRLAAPRLCRHLPFFDGRPTRYMAIVLSGRTRVWYWLYNVRRGLRIADIMARLMANEGDADLSPGAAASTTTYASTTTDAEAVHDAEATCDVKAADDGIISDSEFLMFDGDGDDDDDDGYDSDQYDNIDFVKSYASSDEEATTYRVRRKVPTDLEYAINMPISSTDRGSSDMLAESMGFPHRALDLLGSGAWFRPADETASGLLVVEPGPFPQARHHIPYSNRAWPEAFRSAIGPTMEMRLMSLVAKVDEWESSYADRHHMFGSTS